MQTLNNWPKDDTVYHSNMQETSSFISSARAWMENMTKKKKGRESKEENLISIVEK